MKRKFQIDESEDKIMSIITTTMIAVADMNMDTVMDMDVIAVKMV
jgi:hypothetical protein